MWRLCSAGITLTGLCLLGALAGGPAPAAADKDILDSAADSGQFRTLTKAAGAAGLVDRLKGAGPFTVFAPTDEAFAKLPRGKLKALLGDKAALTAVLTYHILPGHRTAADLVKLDSVKTVQGQSLRIATYGHKIKVGGAQVIRADLRCTNGVIHVIDAVLLLHPE
jgi:uncharacterized surface protein with fasciclin (FAS1) repeats